MEDIGILDPMSENHLYALHYIFIPVINNALHIFIRSWNSHSISTSNAKTPMQLYMDGMIRNKQGGMPALDYFLPVDDEYGVENAGCCSQIDQSNSISVPEVQVNVTEEMLEVLKQSVDPLGDSNNFRIDLYEIVLNLLMI